MQDSSSSDEDAGLDRFLSNQRKAHEDQENQSPQPSPRAKKQTVETVKPQDDSDRWCRVQKRKYPPSKKKKKENKGEKKMHESLSVLC